MYSAGDSCSDVQTDTHICSLSRCSLYHVAVSLLFGLSLWSRCVNLSDGNAVYFVSPKHIYGPVTVCVSAFPINS
jgi:hypothetical protein